MCGMFFNIAENDALAKARGEPTRGFHNIQPNYSNPEIMAAVADKKAGRSTNFYDTGAPNVWQQYADKESKAVQAEVQASRQAVKVANRTVTRNPGGLGGGRRRELIEGGADRNLGKKTLMGA